MNAANSRHCISCGARVAQGPLPMAPQPLVRSTAGSRALIVTAAVIAVVVVIALFYNAFAGDDETSPTTAANGSGATTTSTVAGNGGGTPTETVELTANRVVPSAQLSGFPADNLIDSDPLTMWQVGQEGVGATLTFFFPNPVALERIEIKNISDETKFRQNFRVRGIRIRPNDTTRDTVVELANTRDVQADRHPDRGNDDRAGRGDIHLPGRSRRRPEPLQRARHRRHQVLWERGDGG